MGRKRLTDFDLPERVYLWHTTYYFIQPDGTRVRLTDKRSDVAEAMRRAGLKPTEMLEKHLVTILGHARKNARSRDLTMNLARPELRAIWIRSAGRCELTGIKFDLINGIGYRRRPYAPSIDRIDSREGYSAANCRLVVVAMNLAMNEWGHEVFSKIASGYLRRAAKNISLANNITQGR